MCTVRKTYTIYATVLTTFHVGWNLAFSTVFPPSFVKYPIQERIYGTERGDVTIICQPEAAPAAQKTWLKDNRRLDPSTNENDRVHRLQNGNLRLTGLRSSDEGVYKCEAVNSEGEASSEGTLSVLRESTLASYCSKLYTYVLMCRLSFMLCML